MKQRLTPIILLALTLLVAFATMSNASPGITDREIYTLGQSVQLTLPASAGTRLTIEGPDAAYRLLGEIGATQIFTPTTAGDYTITIFDERGAILVQSAFRVIDSNEGKTSKYAINIDPLEPHAGRNVTIRISPAPIGVVDIAIQAPGGKFKYVGPWQDAAFVPKEQGPHEITLTQNGVIVGQHPFVVLPEPARLLSVAKTSYGPGEQIAITAAPGVGTAWYLLITSGAQTSKYYGTEQTITFTPLEGGRQMIQAVATDGKILDEIIVEAAEPGLAIASSGFVIEDRNGKHRPMRSELIETPSGLEVEVTNPIASLESIRIRGLASSVLTRLRAEDLAPVAVNGIPAVKSFAIDPTTMIFSNATVSAIARGTELYKCVDYVFGTNVCSGEWTKVRDLNPGEEYRFLLTPQDPLYSELNTSISCGCEHRATSDDATRSCSIYCNYTINVPANTTSFYLSSLRYNVTLTITNPGGATLSNGRHWGFFDHDENRSNADDVRLGNSTNLTTSTWIWENATIASSGARSFTQDDCDNWPNYCMYKIYLNASLSFTTPGSSTRDVGINISLNSINYTLNYTVPGPFSVILNTPETNTYSIVRENVTFNYTPTSGTGNLLNCSLWTNETSWSLKVLNQSALVNASANYLNNTFATDGTYVWNVQCMDTTNTSIFAATNRTLIVDATPPIPTQISPANATTYTQGNVVPFTYNVTDGNAIANCSVYIDGEIAKTDTSVLRDIDQTINHNLINGIYDWSIGCWDVAGNFNATSNRTINVSAQVTILTGLWYETDTNDCSSGPCAISAAQSTDGTANYITGTLAASTTSSWYVNATSTYVGSNGGFINAGSTISFSSYFVTGSGNILVHWYLYRLLEDGSHVQICANTAGTATSSGAASTGTCSNSSDVRLLSTDQFLYRIDIQNSHPSQVRSFNHTIDFASSFFNVTNFTQVGTLVSQLLTPTTNLTLLQGDSFTLTCNATCVGGTCLQTNTYAQTNTSGSWVAVGTSGNLTLNGSESNPHVIGTLVNTSNVTSFAINGSQPGTTHLRCFTNASYTEDAADTIIRVTVSNNQAPTIALNAPANNSWQNVTNINFTYTPSSLGTIANCTLYLNGAYNQSNQSPIVNNAPNNFSVLNIPQGHYNWSVSCYDPIVDQTGNSSNYSVAIDRERPFNITLNNPDNDVVITNPTINFNWTATDNLAPNMTCQLVINNTVNRTITTYNGTPANATVGIFAIGGYVWYVNCTDLAGNRNQSELRNFTINDEAPRINLTYPANNSGVNTTVVTFLYNASDNYQLANCSLYLNGAYNQSNQSPLQNGPNNFTAVPLFEGLWNWSVTCTDDALNNATAANYTFRVDTTFPGLTLNTPANESVINISSVQFSYTVTDNQLALTCNLYTDGVLNVTDTPTNGTPELNTINGFTDGSHDWNVTCYDIANNSNASQTWNFTINVTPTIALNVPLNGSFVRFNVSLNYTAVDNDGFANCSLYVNATYNQTNVTNVTSGQSRNFSIIDPQEGVYAWNITCTDSGIYGNVNWSDAWIFIVDNTPPAIELLQPPNNATINESSYSFNWTATDNLAPTLLCNLTLNATVNASNIISTSGGITNYTLTGLRTGEYNWSVVCWDNATNFNLSETRNFSVRIPPKVNLTYPLNNTYDLLPTLNFTYIPYDGTETFVNCSLYVNELFNQTNQSPIATGQPNNFTMNNLADGRYDWNVTCTDTLGLIGQGSGFVYYVDTRAPYNITLITPPNDTTVVRNNVTFSYIQYDITSPNASCRITLDDGGGAFNITPYTTVPNATERTDYYILSDGIYSWNVTCIDIAGNLNSSVTYNFTIIAPPNITLQAPPNETWNNTGNITFVYLPDDDILIKNCTLYLNGIANVSSAGILNKQNNTFSLVDSQSAIYNWTVGCFDSDDNFFAPANRTLYIDRLLPTIDLNDPAAASTLLISTVTFNWTASDNLAYNLTCDLTINGTVNQSSVIVNNSIPYATPIPGFTDGLFLWNVTCADQAFNTNTSTTQNFTVAEPPTILLHIPANATRTANVTLNFTYTPNDNSGSLAACSLLINDAVNATNTTPLTLQALSNLTGTGFTNGIYTWNVNCTDPSGNTGRNATNYTLYIDLAGPAINLTYPPNGTTFNTNNITFNWTPTDFNTSVNITCNLSVSNTSGTLQVTDLSNWSGSAFTARIDGLEDGIHYWNVTCVDDLGNSNISETFMFNINQPDLYLDTGRIGFNNTNPDIDTTINITANVSNIGGVDATGANVTFWDGDPAGSGTYIGSMVLNVVANSSALFSTPWVITAGYHTIYVSADPQGLITELIETNNNATRNISAILINVTTPPNNTYTSDTTPQVDFNITDFTANNLSYTIYIDGTRNGQNGTAINGANVSINSTTLTDGVHTIIVQANDTLGRYKNATARTVRIDTTAPTTNFTTANASWFATTSVTIRFNITDLLSTNINWSAYLDGILNGTNITTNASGANVTFTGVAEGAHSIIIQATDELGNTGNSTTLTFYVDTTPPEPNITTANHSWFNTQNPNISLRIIDNLDTILNWTFFVDNVVNTNGSAANGTSTSGLLAGLSEGNHTIILQAYDEAGNYANSTMITINVDLTAPNVTLISPANGTNFSTTSVTLNFTATDNLASVLACSLTLDGGIVSQFNLSNGTYGTYEATNLAGGTHTWNATCLDNATNTGTSQTWQFSINLPDFIITAGNITLSNSTPIENQTIQINATIFNIGDINQSGNITVQFWRGDPDAGGVQIGGNHTVQGLNISQSATINITYNAIVGINAIYVVVDPPYASNGSIPEKNETNNKAFVTFNVGLFQVFAGASINELAISDAAVVAAFAWNVSNTTGSNVFVADSESSITFTSLYAIGRNTTNGTSVGTNDFEEIDTRMNTSALNDSVNATFTAAGEPVGSFNITAFKREIIHIPAVNSTNTSAFRTGILWDASDASPGYYNGSQDIVFVTIMNQSQVGQYGTYDYEIKIPSTLRDYMSGGNTVTFYTELR